MISKTAAGAFEQLQADLHKLQPEYFISKWVIESVPSVFADDDDAFWMWKHKLGDLIQVDPAAILIIGSAAAGVSLAPHKAFKPLTASSDVDVAVISDHHFDIVWRWLRNLGASRYGLPDAVQKSIEEHRTRLVYWGILATDKLLPYTPLGKRWVPALSEMTKSGPTAGRDVNIRLYRDFDALRSYQVNGVRELRAKLSAKGK